MSNNLNEQINKLISVSLDKIENQEYPSALESLKKAEELDSANPVVMYNKGIVYSKMNLWLNSTVCFEKILSSTSTFVDVLLVQKLLIYSYIMLGEYQQAEDLIDEILVKYPQEISFLSMKGYCYEKSGEGYKAIRIYRQILEIDTRNYNAMNSLAYLLAETEQHLDEAERLVAKLVEQFPSVAAYLDTAGYVALKQENLLQAQEYYEKAFELAPDLDEIKEHIFNLRKEIYKRNK